MKTMTYSKLLLFSIMLILTQNASSTIKTNLKSEMNKIKKGGNIKVDLGNLKSSQELIKYDFSNKENQDLELVNFEENVKYAIGYFNLDANSLFKFDKDSFKPLRGKLHVVSFKNNSYYLQFILVGKPIKDNAIYEIKTNANMIIKTNKKESLYIKIYEEGDLLLKPENANKIVLKENHSLSKEKPKYKKEELLKPPKLNKKFFKIESDFKLDYPEIESPKFRIMP